MSNTSNSDKTDKVEVITSVQRRRRWTVAEKLQMVEESEFPGMSVSYVARGGYPMKRVCEALGVARSNIAERCRNKGHLQVGHAGRRKRGPYQKAMIGGCFP